MIQLNDPALKRALIEKHHFQEHFSLDLEKCSVLLRCEAGETLCHSGAIYPEIQLLADGALIASSVSKSGKLHCELQYQSPNILGLTSALWNKPAINTIEALTPCLCLSLSWIYTGRRFTKIQSFSTTPARIWQSISGKISFTMNSCRPD